MAPAQPSATTAGGGGQCGNGRRVQPRANDCHAGRSGGSLGLAWLAIRWAWVRAFANVLLFMLLVMVVLAVIGMLRRGVGAAVTPAKPGIFYHRGASAALPITMPRQQPDQGGQRRLGPSLGRSRAAPFDAGGDSGFHHRLRAAVAQGWGVPADFDIASFTEPAKRNFTLQDAWDRSDIPALRAADDRRMLAEIQSPAGRARTQCARSGQPDRGGDAGGAVLGIEELTDVYAGQRRFRRHDPRGRLGRPEPLPRGLGRVWAAPASRGGWLVAGCRHCSENVPGRTGPGGRK